MSKPIPVASNLKSEKEIRRAKRAAYYRLRTELNDKIRDLFPDIDDKGMEGMMKSYMTMMTLEPEEGTETVEINIKIVQQMALLCAQQMAVRLVERFS